jgi:hypothetical protein
VFSNTGFFFICNDEARAQPFHPYQSLRTEVP